MIFKGTSHRRFGVALLEWWFEHLIDIHIADCFQFFGDTGMALVGHPVEIDKAGRVFVAAYEILLSETNEQPDHLAEPESTVLFWN